MMEGITIVIPVPHATDLGATLVRARCWLKANATPDQWTYDINFKVEVSITFIFVADASHTAMLFKLAM